MANKNISSSKKSIESSKKVNENYKKNSSLLNFYNAHMKKILIFTFLLLILSISQLIYQNITEGTPIKKGISLTGGTEVTIYYKIENFEQLIDDFKKNFKEVRHSEIYQFGNFEGYVLETQEQDSSKIKEILEKNKIDLEKVNIRTTSSELSKSFFKEILSAILIAYLIMSIVIFLRFKNFFVSFTMILANISNLIITLAILNIIDFKLSIAGISALLMLIGYSIDTNILLATRLIKEKGNIEELLSSSLKTGLLMSLTTLATVSLGYLFTNSTTIKEIMLILIIGLISDIIMTWLQNVSLLLNYLKSKNKLKF
ncbi:MAG: hypothetical protein QXR30_00585 [Candidatus Woesearchaeota archaeon]